MNKVWETKIYGEWADFFKTIFVGFKNVKTHKMNLVVPDYFSRVLENIQEISKCKRMNLNQTKLNKHTNYNF
jgi:hypothetical protein